MSFKTLEIHGVLKVDTRQIRWDHKNSRLPYKSLIPYHPLSFSYCLPSSKVTSPSFTISVFVINIFSCLSSFFSPFHLVVKGIAEKQSRKEKKIASALILETLEHHCRKSSFLRVNRLHEQSEIVIMAKAKEWPFLNCFLSFSLVCSFHVCIATTVSKHTRQPRY